MIDKFRGPYLTVYDRLKFDAVPRELKWFPDPVRHIVEI